MELVLCQYRIYKNLLIQTHNIISAKKILLLNIFYQNNQKEIYEIGGTIDMWKRT